MKPAAPRAAPRPRPQEAIPFLSPELPALDLLMRDFARIYAAGTFSNHGPFERTFSQRIAEELGVRHALPVSNATVGLMIAMKALARRIPGGKAVMPSFTFAATALAAEWAGLTPVFVDVHDDTWQAKVPGQLEAMRDDTALLVPCNTFGAPCDVDAWKRAGAELGLPVLVDSAPGLGADYADGRKQGQSGCVEVFSLHATKAFAIGEGGLITTDDDALAATLARMRNFGFNERRDCFEMGLNAKMSEMQAAVANRVLDGFDTVRTHRRARAAQYRARLARRGFRFQVHGEHSVFQAVPVRVPAPVDVVELTRHLAHQGIETRRYFAPALHRHPRYEKAEVVGRLTVTEALSASMISLPMNNRLTEAQVDRVCDAIEAFLES